MNKYDNLDYFNCKFFSPKMTENLIFDISTNFDRKFKR